MLRTSGFWIVVSSSYVTIYTPRHINVPANFFQWDKPSGSHPPISRLPASNFSLLCSIHYSLLIYILIFHGYGRVIVYGFRDISKQEITEDSFMNRNSTRLAPSVRVQSSSFFGKASAPVYFQCPLAVEGFFSFVECGMPGH